MSDLEDLSAKAARLWLQFMQAQAKAAADAAKKLPDVTRSLFEAGVPLAAEMHRWVGGTSLPSPHTLGAGLADAASHEEEPLPARQAVVTTKPRSPRPLTRANHRRLKTPKSMSRRRARRP